MTHAVDPAIVRQFANEFRQEWRGLGEHYSVLALTAFIKRFSPEARAKIEQVLGRGALGVSLVKIADWLAPFFGIHRPNVLIPHYLYRHAEEFAAGFHQLPEAIALEFIIPVIKGLRARERARLMAALAEIA